MAKVIQFVASRTRAESEFTDLSQIWGKFANFLVNTRIIIFIERIHYLVVSFEFLSVIKDARPRVNYDPNNKILIHYTNILLV